MNEVERRIRDEYCDVLNRPRPGIEVEAVPGNRRHFNAVLLGPKDSPYENGRFAIEFFYPNDYPAKPPLVIFRTKIFHPNVDLVGRVDHPVLRHWKPATTMAEMLAALRNLLGFPDSMYALDMQVKAEWDNDLDAALTKAREWTLQYAT